MTATAPRDKWPSPPSEGCKLFRAATLNQSLGEIARNISSKNKTSINDVLHGHKLPSPAMRATIEVVYGVAPRSWERAAASNGHTLALAPDIGPPPPTLAHCLEALQSIRVARSAPDLVSSERVRLVDSETKLIALRARLEMQQELSEHRIVRAHPEWHRLKRLIALALKPYPEALRAVAAAIQEDLDVQR